MKYKIIIFLLALFNPPTSPKEPPPPRGCGQPPCLAGGPAPVYLNVDFKNKLIVE